MERILQILNRTQFGFLATVKDGNPRVRPFQFQFEDKGRLYFCTSKGKRVTEQLRQNPYVEYSAYNKAFEYIRVFGEIFFYFDFSLKKKVFELNPYYKEEFKSPENENMILFYIEHGTAELGHFNTYPPEVIKF